MGSPGITGPGASGEEAGLARPVWQAGPVWRERVEHGVAVAVHRHAEHLLQVAGGVALAPELLAAARPVGAAAGGQRLLQGGPVGPGQHEDRAVLLLGHHRHQAPLVVLHEVEDRGGGHAVGHQIAAGDRVAGAGSWARPAAAGPASGPASPLAAVGPGRLRLRGRFRAGPSSVRAALLMVSPRCRARAGRPWPPARCACRRGRWRRPGPRRRTASPSARCSSVPTPPEAMTGMVTAPQTCSRSSRS